MKDLIGDKVIKIDGKEHAFKLTNGALYRTQKDLKKKGLMEIIQALDGMDFEALFCLLKHGLKGCPLKLEELLEADVDLPSIVEIIGEELRNLMERKESKEVAVAEDSEKK